ncbi:LysE family translocator [Saccharicrinis sp. FJH62]|uniref:LysE family translocator n=1 Tax=Saccharicrinis sp. FJH62 TaxID=3344657 RepID=UPI0035D4F075
MLFEKFFDGIIIGLLASVPLGPIGVLIIQRTMNKGRHSGLASGIGAAFSDMIYAIIAGFSISYIIDFVKEQQSWIQLFGSLVMIVFGYFTFRSNPAVQLRKAQKQSGTGTYIQDMITTFGLTISNPLLIFVFIGVFAGFKVMQGGGMAERLIVIPGIFSGAILWWFSLSFIVSLFRKKINLRGLWRLNRITGLIIIALSVISLVYAILELTGVILPEIVV